MMTTQGTISMEIEKVNRRMGELEKELNSLAAVKLALQWAEGVNNGNKRHPVAV